MEADEDGNDAFEAASALLPEDSGEQATRKVVVAINSSCLPKSIPTFLLAINLTNLCLCYFRTR